MIRICLSQSIEISLNSASSYIKRGQTAGLMTNHVSEGLRTMKHDEHLTDDCGGLYFLLYYLITILSGKWEKGFS